jgi:F-box protein 21
MALQNDEHPSLPLISVVIFCALAQRLGLDARACGIPAHAHAMVFAPQGHTLDGRLLQDHDEEQDRLYLNPYTTDEEVPIHTLLMMLTGWGIDPSRHHLFILEASLSFVILRTSRNIIATVQGFRHHATHLTNNIGASITARPRPDIQLYGNQFVDLEHAFYSAVWVRIFGSSYFPIWLCFMSRKNCF